jgi:hypothetical protein
MDVKAVIKSQYHAALKMLASAIVQCPDALWDHTDQVNKFWHTVFHALFYTHLYLQTSEDGFTPWEKHEEKFISLEGGAIPDDQKNSMRGPYQREELLEYLEFCREEVEKQIAVIDLDAESGFYWLPFNKLELQFYNIRHIQHHTGELYHLLEGLQDAELKWVGMSKEK